MAGQIPPNPNANPNLNPIGVEDGNAEPAVDAGALVPAAVRTIPETLATLSLRAIARQNGLQRRAQVIEHLATTQAADVNVPADFTIPTIQVIYPDPVAEVSEDQRRLLDLPPFQFAAWDDAVFTPENRLFEGIFQAPVPRINTFPADNTTANTSAEDFLQYALNSFMYLRVDPNNRPFFEERFYQGQNRQIPLCDMVEHYTKPQRIVFEQASFATDLPAIVKDFQPYTLYVLKITTSQGQRNFLIIPAPSQTLWYIYNCDGYSSMLLLDDSGANPHPLLKYIFTWEDGFEAYCVELPYDVLPCLIRDIQTIRQLDNGFEVELDPSRFQLVDEPEGEDVPATGLPADFDPGPQPPPPPAPAQPQTLLDDLEELRAAFERLEETQRRQAQRRQRQAQDEEILNQVKGILEPEMLNALFGVLSAEGAERLRQEQIHMYPNCCSETLLSFIGNRFNIPTNFVFENYSHEQNEQLDLAGHALILSSENFHSANNQAELENIILNLDPTQLYLVRHGGIGLEGHNAVIFHQDGHWQQHISVGLENFHLTNIDGNIADLSHLEPQPGQPQWGTGNDAHNVVIIPVTQEIFPRLVQYVREERFREASQRPNRVPVFQLTFGQLLRRYPVLSASEREFEGCTNTCTEQTLSFLARRVGMEEIISFNPTEYPPENDTIDLLTILDNFQVNRNTAPIDNSIVSAAQSITQWLNGLDLANYYIVWMGMINHFGHNFALYFEGGSWHASTLHGHLPLRLTNEQGALTPEGLRFFAGVRDARWGVRVGDYSISYASVNPEMLQAILAVVMDEVVAIRARERRRRQQ